MVSLEKNYNTMLFDNTSNEKSFFEIDDRKEIDEEQSRPIDSDIISPSSLPELNVSSPNAPSGTMQSPVQEEESSKKILKCDYCDKTFTLANVLKVHQRIHTGEKPYVCEICGKAFNQSGSLNRHRNTHRYRDATDNNFICRFCNAKFPHGSLLETHEKSAHHNRRSGRPRNLSSVDSNTNNNNNNDDKTVESFSKFNFLRHDDTKHDKLSPLTNENGDGKTDSSSIIRDHKPMGGNGEYPFTCPYCQLGLNDIRDLGIHLSHHNISNGLNPASVGINSHTNPMLSKNNPLFSSESLVQQLASLSKKLKIPPISDFNFGSMTPAIPIDRLKVPDSLPNINFHMQTNAQSAPVLSESYNLAAFVLATLSKDYMYKQRNQPLQTLQENGFQLPTTEFLKSHLFPQKSPLLGPIPTGHHLDFYNLFNLQKPMNNSGFDLDNKSASEINQNIEMHNHNNYNGKPSPSARSSPSFISKSHRNAPVMINKRSSSPVSSVHTTRTSSNKTADLFFSRKNGGERRKCPDCDKQFTCESALRIHYRKHSGERPYACEFCSKTFSQNGTLKRHHLTCKNRPNVLSTKKSSISQDPDSTQEVNNSSTGSHYGPTSSPTYPSATTMSYALNGKILNSYTKDSVLKFDNFTATGNFQTSYSSGDVSRKTSELRSPYNNIGSSEEPTDLTINGSRNEETVSQSMDEETHLDIDSVDDKPFTLKIENNNSNDDMEVSDSKIDIPTEFGNPNPESYSFNCDKNIIYNFSTKEILAHLVDSGRLMTCRHCLVYFETENSYSGHIKSHYNHHSAVHRCTICTFVTHDEGAFKGHFNEMDQVSKNQ